MPTKLPNPWKKYPVRWGIVGWISAVHLLGLVAAPLYITVSKYSPATLTMAAVLFFLSHITITAGTHRLYAHATYKANRWLELYHVLLFPAVFQSSTIWWAAYHIDHHAYSDSEKDPYTVRHGFWWAHMVWVFFAPETLPPSSRALARNKLLTWQHRNYYLLAPAMGLGLPAALGWLWDDLIGGLLVGGFLRLAIQYHVTWTINSVAHTWGTFIYSVRRTPRTNWVMAILNVGEGYHERHHWAEDDYRLGPKWFNWDPGKWFIWLCSLPGWAYDLKRISEEEIRRRIALHQSAQAVG